MSSNRVFVVPANDLEALAIAELLRRNNERCLITGQPWGASWQGLESHLREQLAGLPQETAIYGVELSGPNSFGALNIDHHKYQSEDRWQESSSIEQVAAILGVELNRTEQLIAANDRGYIPAMKVIGATDLEIEEIRRSDRLAQGITEMEEERAEKEISAARIIGAKAWVDSSGIPTSAHADRLYGLAPEWMVAGLGEWAYSGPRHRELASLTSGENNWSGGAAESGYAGVAQPTIVTRERLREWFWR